MILTKFTNTLNQIFVLSKIFHPSKSLGKRNHRNPTQNQILIIENTTLTYKKNPIPLSTRHHKPSHQNNAYNRLQSTMPRRHQRFIREFPPINIELSTFLNLPPCRGPRNPRIFWRQLTSCLKTPSLGVAQRPWRANEAVSSTQIIPAACCFS